MRQELTTQQEQAACLVAEDTVSDEMIADAAGVSRATLSRWKKQPEFQNRVADLKSKLRARFEKESLTAKENRLRLLEEIVQRMLGTMDQRSVDTFLKNTPGGDTGIVKMEVGVGGRGWQYSIDPTLLKELRDYLKQIAQETGDWADKTQVSGEVVLRRYIGVNVEDV